MRALCFVGLLLLCFSLHAEQRLVAHDRAGQTVWLSQEPCRLASHPLMQSSADYKAASALVAKQLYAACWRLVAGGIVILLYEDGDVGEFPAAAFKRASSS